MYHRNFWRFCTNLVEDKANHDIPLTKECLDNHFQSTCSRKCSEAPKTDWFPDVTTPIVKEFNLQPIRACEVSAASKPKKNTSSPGPDGITYAMLKRFSPIPHFLATIFNKIFESSDPPKSWRVSRTVLIFKSGDKLDPKNYRPISLSSCVGKLFHTVLNSRLLK